MLTMRTVKPAEERRSEILDVAEQLFATKGFDNTSTNDIINAIGIARGTLYHHFKSKEDILDAVINRITEALMRQAEAIAVDKSIPLLERLAKTVMSLNVESQIGDEVKLQVHKPQNALLHQKMSQQLISGVVPIVASLIEEGCREGIFDTSYPTEAVEMVMIYSNIAFDELAQLSTGERMQKIQAFIYHTERIMGAEEGLLQEPMSKIFGI
ncbi:MAG: TetR/AcrR family transcriptional regulator [Atopobiaceae bacterium]|nr:TetR/AcrR family transcriptional regulator [Atopobiaceae bacterium]